MMAKQQKTNSNPSNFTGNRSTTNPNTNTERKNKANHSTPSGKKPIPGPTHIGNFIMMLLMKVCKRILFVDTSTKIGVYLIGVVTGSVIADLFIFPKTVMADKRNSLNVYFIKLGWGWTLVSIGTYIFLTTLIYCCRDYAKMCQHGMRLVVGTFWWYVCTKTFNHVENVIGVCTHSHHSDKAACLEAGKHWRGFDISGHVFLEIHCLLIISEELKSFKQWTDLGKLLNDDNLKERIRSRSRSIPENELSQAQMNYKTFTPYIKILASFITIIFVLFEFMLVVSTVYRFHTLFQKVTAAFTAVGCWFISYRVIFRSRHPYPFFPTFVGESALAYTHVE